MLVRRTKKALAGWADDFTRPNESPIAKPWGLWGSPRTVNLVSNRMVLGIDGDWTNPNPNGGVAFEQQPLTPNWVLKFRKIQSSTGNGELSVYIDRNWTQGVTNNRYQIVITLRRYTDTKRDPDTGETTRTTKRQANIYARDTQGGWFTTTYGTSETMSDAEWNDTRVSLLVFEDRFFFFQIGTATVGLQVGDIVDANYRTGPGKRAANFMHQNGPAIQIDEFATYDRPALKKNWASVLYEDFNRANSTTVGNGWSQGGGQFGILNNALSMQTGFPGDGYRGIWRDLGGDGNMRLEITGAGGVGGTGDQNTIAEQGLLLRVNSAGSLAIGAFIFEDRVVISKMSSSIGVPNPTFTQSAIRANLTTPIGDTHKISFSIVGDECWVWNETMGELLIWCEGMNAVSPPSNTGVGLMVRRAAFVNSNPYNDFRALVAA